MFFFRLTGNVVSILVTFAVSIYTCHRNPSWHVLGCHPNYPSRKDKAYN